MSRTPLRTIVRSNPFQHDGPNGTRLMASRIDLTGKNRLIRPDGITESQFAQDITAIIGWWCMNIQEDMLADGNGFNGFGYVKYEIIRLHEMQEYPKE